ncbi:hypothetical protein BN77_3107 [Rhizobium mesoamericanum STM3625]|uniref:Uncharacterized protein n=1 Tax=Rhizobium mesoamericanum STM3625 TaxID=1211777 RepID=K0PX43_9HYPH|nr:hypothetical protein BN77_3107 [Rhizobium mesoamericanum STM3625]
MVRFRMEMIGAIKGLLPSAAGVMRRYISALSNFDIPAQMNRVFTRVKMLARENIFASPWKTWHRSNVISR